MLQRHIIVDWDVVPAQLVKMPFKPDAPSFHVVRGRTGTYWSSIEPNALILRWLLDQAEAEKDLGE